MKPAFVINQGENFVTLRATTDRPAEIREALATRDVQHVFKGDQNQAWDAVLANHCLNRAVGEDGTDLTFFVQDEKLGTADARLARLWRALGRRYVLTEDYYRGRAGAVWEHQDSSYGLFFTEAVAPEQFARAGVHLHRAAELWEKHAAAALEDPGFVEGLAALGVTYPRDGRPARADAATRLGAAVAPEVLGGFFTEHPTAGMFYALTKTDGLYGVVPVETEDVSLSSVPAGEPELREAGRRLLLRSARGAMRLAGSAVQRRGIKTRARQLGEWAGELLAANPAASVADFQIALGQRLTAEIFPADKLALDRTSRFMQVPQEELGELRAPERTLHFFLDLALRHPREFTEAYNVALNRVGFGLQRMKYDSRTGEYAPPFFVELAPGGPGTPVYRYGIRLTGTDATTVTLSNATTETVVLETDRRIRSAYDLLAALHEGLPHAAELAVVGKAAPFAAELQRAPRGLGLPRQGSKYAPMVDHLVSGLRKHGVLAQPTGLLIRIGLNALDRLQAMGETPLRVPRFLEGPLGRRTTCQEVAGRWREVARQARDLLELLSGCCFGQHVHLVKAICLNARGQDWNARLAADVRLRNLVERLEPDSGVQAFRRSGVQADGEQPTTRLRSLGCDVPLAAVEAMERLTARREELLHARRELVEVKRAEAAGAGSRRLPPLEAEEALDAERQRIECQLLLLFAAYVRRLWQRAESLAYVNDRPYTLALYLLFGRDIFPPICRQVEFDVEYISPSVTDRLPVSCA